MSERELPARRDVCTGVYRTDLVNSYCFGDLDETRRRDFEIHLLECDYCWRQVETLDPAVDVLRSGRHATHNIFARPVFSETLNKVFGGHVFYVLLICLVYATLYALALLVEVAYEFEQLGSMAIRLAPFIFLWIFATAVLGLALDWKLTIEGKANGLIASLSVYAAAAGALYLAMRLFLPTDPTVQANFQTFTAQAGYLKSILHFLFLSAIFWLPLFHFVVVMQREILAGRHRMVFAVLMNEPWSLKPRGTIFPRFSTVLILWVVVVSGRLFGTLYMFNNLRPSPNLNLFMNLVEAAFFLYFLLGTGSIVWYSRALDLLKRECLALLAMQSRSQAVLPPRNSA